MANIFTKILGFFRSIVARPGFKEFVAKYEEQALSIVAQLASVNNNAAFAEWKDQAFAALKRVAGDAKDNWVAIAIHIAYETLKARQ